MRLTGCFASVKKGVLGNNVLLVNLTLGLENHFVLFSHSLFEVPKPDFENCVSDDKREKK